MPPACHNRVTVEHEHVVVRRIARGSTQKSRIVCRRALEHVGDARNVVECIVEPRTRGVGIGFGERRQPLRLATQARVPVDLRRALHGGRFGEYGFGCRRRVAQQGLQTIEARLLCSGIE